jgi:hypothetical protein
VHPHIQPAIDSHSAHSSGLSPLFPAARPLHSFTTNAYIKGILPSRAFVSAQATHTSHSACHLIARPGRSHVQPSHRHYHQHWNKLHSHSSIFLITYTRDFHPTMASNTQKTPESGDTSNFQPTAHHDHVVFKPSALQTVSIPDSPPADEGNPYSSAKGDKMIGVVESVPLASPAPMNPPSAPNTGIVAPTPQPFHSNAHGFAFTPMGSTSQTPAQDAFMSEFDTRSSSPTQAVSLSRQTSFSASNPASRIQSRRGSSYAPHPMATGPPARPPLRSDSGMQGTPSLLSRAGSPTLPLMSDKTRSRSSSFVGTQGDAFGAGFGQGAFGMSALRGTKKAGEFVGSVDCGTT